MYVVYRSVDGFKDGCVVFLEVNVLIGLGWDGEGDAYVLPRGGGNWFRGLVNTSEVLTLVWVVGI